MLASIQRVTETQPGDWTILSDSHTKSYQRALELSKRDPVLGYGMAVHTQRFIPVGNGGYQTRYRLANNALGLPEEDLDKATKAAHGNVQDLV